MNSAGRLKIPLAIATRSHYLERMSTSNELDSILAALATASERVSPDLLLDLRQAAGEPGMAGRCVSLYFALLESAPDTGGMNQAMARLRSWLESSLKIEVLDEERSVRIESLPLRFRGETSLSDFCHGAMRHLRDDRCHEVPRLRLQFGFAQK